MTTDLQKETLAALAEIWSLSPDVRLGQLFAHLGFLGEAHLQKGLGDIEDDELMAILYRHLRELQSRTHDANQQTPQLTSDSTSVSGSPIVPVVAHVSSF